MTPGDTSLPSVLVPKADFLESLQRWAVTSLLFHQAQPKPPQPGNSYSISVSHCSPGGPRKEREGQQDEQASAKDTEALVASRNLPAACRELQQRPPCPCLPPPGRLGSSGSPVPPLCLRLVLWQLMPERPSEAVRPCRMSMSPAPGPARGQRKPAGPRLPAAPSAPSLQRTRERPRAMPGTHHEYRMQPMSRAVPRPVTRFSSLYRSWPKSGTQMLLFFPCTSCT